LHRHLWELGPAFIETADAAEETIGLLAEIALRVRNTRSVGTEEWAARLASIFDIWRQRNPETWASAQEQARRLEPAPPWERFCIETHQGYEIVEWLIAPIAEVLGRLPMISGDQSASVQAYASASQALLTLVLAPITIYAAVMARNAWVASRHQRHDALMPLLEAELVLDVMQPATMARFQLAVRNVGVGPAIQARVTPIARGGSDRL
jgi:hypothetical protein